MSGRGWLGIQYLAANSVAIGAGTVWNYGSNHRWTWSATASAESPGSLGRRVSRIQPIGRDGRGQRFTHVTPTDKRPASVSVIVCTRDRPDSIGQTLESLASQDHPSPEVLVVDQSRSEQTRIRVERYRRRLPQLGYIHLDEPGLSRAYNAGVRAASSDLLAFIDDDCVASTGWLGAIVTAFNEHPEVGLIYGQVLLPRELAARENASGVTPGLPIPERRILSREHGFRVFGMGANFAARRHLFDVVGGFDEVLGGGGPLQSSQDFDFTYRVFRHGRPILLEPEVIVYHYGFRAHADWLETVGSYGYGVGGFYFKHVRLGDPLAARLLLSVGGVAIVRLIKRWLTLAPSDAQWVYLRRLCAGVIRSSRFQIDRSAGVYLPRRSG